MDAAVDEVAVDVEGTALAGALAPVLEVVALDALPLGGSTDTPVLLDDVLLPLAAELEDAVPLAGELPVVALDEPVGAVDEPDVVVEGVLLDGVGDVVDDVDGVVAAGGVAVWVCAGGVLVRVPCPTGKNEPPVISVAMMPAITATRAMPISRSGQLRRNQSMIPF